MEKVRPFNKVSELINSKGIMFSLSWFSSFKRFLILTKSIKKAQAFAWAFLISN